MNAKLTGQGDDDLPKIQRHQSFFFFFFPDAGGGGGGNPRVFVSGFLCLWIDLGGPFLV